MDPLVQSVPHVNRKTSSTLDHVMEQYGRESSPNSERLDHHMPPHSWNDGSMPTYGSNGQWSSMVNSPSDHHIGVGLYDPLDPNDSAASRRNRGNYRCSKCGEPKKGHVCAYQPVNYKCARCGNPKKSCSCGTPDSFSIGIQAEMDERMTVRVLNLNEQGITDFHPSVSNILEKSTFEV